MRLCAHKLLFFQPAIRVADVRTRYRQMTIALNLPWLCHLVGVLRE